MTVFVRILLRVAAGWLLARGMPEDVVSVLYEPDITFAVHTAMSAAVWGAAEVWYFAARKLGWRT